VGRNPVECRWSARRESIAPTHCGDRCVDPGQNQRELEQQFTPAPEGWAPGKARLRLTGALPLDLAVDTDVANLLVRCDGSLPLRKLLAQVATATVAPADTVARKGAAATRHLIEAGFLLPG
jgi:hypothetical protein